MKVLRIRSKGDADSSFLVYHLTDQVASELLSDRVDLVIGDGLSLYINNFEVKLEEEPAIKNEHREGEICKQEPDKVNSVIKYEEGADDPADTKQEEDDGKQSL